MHESKRKKENIYIFQNINIRLLTWNSPLPISGIWICDQTVISITLEFQTTVILSSTVFFCRIIPFNNIPRAKKLKDKHPLPKRWIGGDVTLLFPLDFWNGGNFFLCLRGKSYGKKETKNKIKNIWYYFFLHLFIYVTIVDAKFTKFFMLIFLLLSNTCRERRLPWLRVEWPLQIYNYYRWQQ